WATSVRVTVRGPASTTCPATLSRTRGATVTTRHGGNGGLHRHRRLPRTNGDTHVLRGSHGPRTRRSTPRAAPTRLLHCPYRRRRGEIVQRARVVEVRPTHK